MGTYYVAGVPYSSELYHHGIKGQRWGIRRFQNPDGSLTAAGRKRYDTRNSNYYTNGRFDRAKGEKYENDRDARIGQDTIDKINEKWYPVISSIYDSDYSAYSGYQKQQHERLKKASEEADRRKAEDFNRILDEERSKKTSLKDRVFKGKDRLYYEARERANTRMKDIPSASESIRAYKELREFEKKIAGEWKDKTMRDILKDIPDSKKDDVYELLRFDWWDYD